MLNNKKVTLLKPYPEKNQWDKTPNRLDYIGGRLYYIRATVLLIYSHSTLLIHKRVFPKSFVAQQEGQLISCLIGSWNAKFYRHLGLNSIRLEH